MSSEEYYSLQLRLKSIRTEISYLKQKPLRTIKDRIQILKETNDLLREQNRILVIRQVYLGGQAV